MRYFSVLLGILSFFRFQRIKKRTNVLGVVRRRMYCFRHSINGNLSGRGPSILLRKTVRSLKSPTGAFIAPLRCETRTCRSGRLHLAYARPFGRLKAPLGLSLLHFAAQTRTTLFLLCTKSYIVWRKIGVWCSFCWKSVKRKSPKLLSTSRSFRLCFA